MLKLIIVIFIVAFTMFEIIPNVSHAWTIDLGGTPGAANKAMRDIQKQAAADKAAADAAAKNAAAAALAAQSGNTGSGPCPGCGWTGTTNFDTNFGPANNPQGFNNAMNFASNNWANPRVTRNPDGTYHAAGNNANVGDRNIGGAGGTTTTTTTATTVVTTTTTTTQPLTCDNNGYCEAGETQDSCPSDCYTSVSINPNVGVVGGQSVTIMISFNDSRYFAGHNANYRLTIDGMDWNSTNGCPIARVNATPQANGINTACSWSDHSLTNPCTSTSVNGYLKLVTQCTLPYNLVGANHVFQAIPTFYSNQLLLKSGTANFTTVGNPLQEFLNWITLLFR